MDRVCHFEIPFDDKSRATDFYRKVFGWEVSDVPGDMPYTFVITTPIDERGSPTTAGGINGGMYPRGEGGGSGSPVVVIEVPSCENASETSRQPAGSASWVRRRSREWGSTPR